MAYSAIADAEIQPNKPVTSSLMTRLRDNPLFILSSLGFATTAKIYKSSEQVVTAASTFTLNHGLTSLTATNSIFQAFLVCKTAELGYSVDDVVPFNPSGEVTGSTNGILSIRLTATQIIGRIGTNALVLGNATTGVNSTITAANWRLVVSLRG